MMGNMMNVNEDTDYKPKNRGRPKGSTSATMIEKRRRAKNLAEVNPTLSMAAIARHVEVSEATVSKWFGDWELRRWFC